MTMARWYVVCWADTYSDEPERPDEGSAVWTVSQDPTVEGWTTDCGHPGYGLTYAQARELADAANARLEGA